MFDHHDLTVLTFTLFTMGWVDRSLMPRKCLPGVQYNIKIKIMIMFTFFCENVYLSM